MPPKRNVDVGVFKFTPDRDKWDGHYEFGGPLANLGIMVFSHFIMYYFWVCIDFFQGNLVYPGHALLEGKPFISTVTTIIADNAAPTYETFFWFTCFLLFEYVMAVALPGPVTYGLPVPSENNARRSYKCNAVYAWYSILVMFGVLHFTDIFPLWRLREDFARYMTVAVFYGDLFSVMMYMSGFVFGRALRNSGNVIYDFFMGSMLNPRLPFGIDVKLFAEIRNSWVILFMLTLSCASKMHHDYGFVTPNMWFMVLAHFLYVNACQKGEECIPTTWDIYYEKFGWMLCFWNTAGVPFVYCFQSMFIVAVNPHFRYSTAVTVAMYVTLLLCYYVWDTANSQKNRFRMKRQGIDDAIIKRKTFPQLPWGYIENPKTLKGENGNELFVDGWYGHGRKIHYTVDMIMAFLWGASCGQVAVIPFFYFVFFMSVLIHREGRDDERCSRKYGPLWKEYVKTVPYKFIPYVY